MKNEVENSMNLKKSLFIFISIEVLLVLVLYVLYRYDVFSYSDFKSIVVSMFIVIFAMAVYYIIKGFKEKKGE